jgi:hypothetical protein
MAHGTQHDAKIKTLETSLNQLSDKLATFGSHSKQITELIPIIHRPGWTTIAEVMLVSGLVESMNKHIDVLNAQHTALIRGAQAVGKTD